jgi:transcriptional regulator with XRE-family HTH domain
MDSDSPGSLFLRQRLRDLREQTGLSQERVAERAGISFIYYQALEAGRRSNLTLGVLEKIATAFGLSLVELFAQRIPTLRLAEDPVSQPHKPRLSGAKVRYPKRKPRKS